MLFYTCSTRWLQIDTGSAMLCLGCGVQPDLVYLQHVLTIALRLRDAMQIRDDAWKMLRTCAIR